MNAGASPTQPPARSSVQPSTEHRSADDEVVTWWGLVIEGYHATQQRITAVITEHHGLSPASLDILLRLLRSPEHRQPMTRLAREVALTSGGFTKVADRLAAAGLIRREPCERDRRVVYAALTERGTDLAVQARASTAEVLRSGVIEPLGEQRAADLAAAMRTLRGVHAPGYPD